MTDRPMPIERSLAELFAVLVRGRVAIIRAGALAGSITLGVVLMQPRTFSSGFAVFPRMAGTGGSQLSSLAAQFGLSMPGVDLTQSPGFYAEMATSPEVLRPIIETAKDATGKPIPLADVLRVTDTDPNERQASLLDALARSVKASVAPKTGLVRVKVITTDPAVSTVLAKQLLDQIQKTTIQMRQRQADADQSFSSERLAEANAELNAAEQRLAGFAVRNRYYQADPAAQVEFGRLQREVQRKQGVVQALQQNVEQTRVDQERDTPVLGVVESVRSPLIPDRRYAAIKAIAGALAAMLLAAAILLMGTSGTPPESSERAWSDVTTSLGTDLRRPWRVPLAVLGFTSVRQR